MERLEAQISTKDREIATITRTVRGYNLCFFLSSAHHAFIWNFSICIGFIILFVLFKWSHDSHCQEAKTTAAFKVQVEKLQQERDEFQRMVIGNQVRILSFNL